MVLFRRWLPLTNLVWVWKKRWLWFESVGDHKKLQSFGIDLEHERKHLRTRRWKYFCSISKTARAHVHACTCARAHTQTHIQIYSLGVELHSKSSFSSSFWGRLALKVILKGGNFCLCVCWKISGKNAYFPKRKKIMNFWPCLYISILLIDIFCHVLGIVLEHYDQVIFGKIVLM